jgi:hypothetical protein
MHRHIDEEIIKGTLEIYEAMKENFDCLKFDKLVEELFKKIRNTPLDKMINFEDFSYTLNELIVKVDFQHPVREHPVVIKLRNITAYEIVKQLKERLLTPKAFDYYVPVYLLYELPKGMSVGYSEIVEFQDLPDNVKDYYDRLWELNYQKNKDFLTLAEAKKQKSESVFLHFSLLLSGKYKASQDAEKIAQDSLTIIGFACGGVNFNLIDFCSTIDANQEVHAEFEGRYELPFESVIGSQRIIKCIHTLTDIFINPNANEIEIKIKNALRIYKLQQPLPHDPVKFLLLVTCFESLLMTKSDRDYILWRLAEKVTFILADTIKDVSMQEINSFIKEAYKKRSAFVHGSTNETITFSDTTRLDVFFYELVWTIIDNFLKQGYTQIQKARDKKSIDEYIENKKFGEKPVVGT